MSISEMAGAKKFTMKLSFNLEAYTTLLVAASAEKLLRICLMII